LPPQTLINSGAEHGASDAQSIVPRLLDVEAAAVYLSVSPWTIRDLVAAGELHRVRLPVGGQREVRRLLLDRRDLDRLVDRSREA
jgi:excisionase family DNA binding protein